MSKGLHIFLQSIKGQQLKSWYSRTFAEKQIFLRSEGRVKFVTLTSGLQVTFACMGLLLLAWGLVSSIGYLTRHQLVAGHKTQISALENNNRALKDGYRLLEGDLESRALILEKRQAFLESVIGADLEITDLPPASDGTSDMVPIPESTPGSSSAIETAPKEKISKKEETKIGARETSSAPDSVENISHVPQRLSRQALKEKLETLEARQRLSAQTALEKKKKALAQIDKALSKTRFTTTDLAALSSEPNQPGRGGPLLPISDFSPVFSSDDYAPFTELSAVWSRLERALLALDRIPIGKPAREYYLSSRFGRRIDPIKKVPANHSGLDLAGWPGTDILAAGPGTVVRAQWYGPYGNMVEIDHGNGFKSRYGHMKKLNVKKGAKVRRGEIIGLMGKTGRVTDTHLHFEIWYKGKLHDPLPFLEAVNAVQNLIGKENYAQATSNAGQ